MKNLRINTQHGNKDGFKIIQKILKVEEKDWL